MFLFEKTITKAVVKNTYILFLFLAYVMRRAGTFSLEDKVKMVEFLGHMAQNPDTEEHHEYVGQLLYDVVPRLDVLVDTGGFKN
tara:strand:+ start:3864 stop:4115 length:252 start_codon:yes stop_codon:yes gene_type:complete